MEPRKLLRNMTVAAVSSSESTCRDDVENLEWAVPDNDANRLPSSTQPKMLAIALAPVAVLVAILLLLTGAELGSTGPITLLIALLGAVAVAFGLAIQTARWVDRTLLDPLRDLKQAMSSIDGTQAAAMGSLTPKEQALTADVGTEDPVYSDLAASVASTHSAARHAAHSAEESRGHLQQVLVDVGVRQHRLATRQLSLLEGIDRDSARSESLATIERLALRSRRTADTVLTLAGDMEIESSGQDETVHMVISRSIAHLDEAQRVDAHSIEDVTVTASAVADLEHILGELIDNAVRCSDSETPVVVLGRHARDGYILSVVDEGPGMTAEERSAANERLAAQAGLFETAPTTFGFVVAGQVAARNDFRVMLLESATDGIIAKLRIPQHALLGGDSSGAGSAH